MSIAMLILAPIGATLKRWHAHSGRNEVAPENDPMGSCLFNPIFYLCLIFVVFASVQAFLWQTIYGRSEPPEAIALGSICGGIIFCVGHTWLVYRYFSKPDRPPTSAFLRSHSSKYLGDAILFINATLFQLVWNLLVDIGFPRVATIGEALVRVPILAFLALLLYFPPRMFYLAREGVNAKTWAFMLLANSPSILRFIIGVEAPQ